jgi:hypothetical protein
MVWVHLKTAKTTTGALVGAGSKEPSSPLEKFAFLVTCSKYFMFSRHSGVTPIYPSRIAGLTEIYIIFRHAENFKTFSQRNLFL